MKNKYMFGIILVCVCVSFSTDLSYRMGDKQGFRLGFNLFRLMDVNVGIDYRSDRFGIALNNVNTSVEYSQMMPVIGTKILLPLSFNPNITAYAGVDYYWSMPKVKFVYVNPGDANANTYSNVINNAAQDYLDKNFSNSGFNFYIESEYFFDDSKGFALVGLFGVQMDVKRFGKLSTGELKLEYVQTMTQIGFTYYFLASAPPQPKEPKVGKKLQIRDIE